MAGSISMASSLCRASCPFFIGDPFIQAYTIQETLASFPGSRRRAGGEPGNEARKCSVTLTYLSTSSARILLLVLSHILLLHLWGGA